MTVIGWIQILLYCAIIAAITPPLGAYMTRVFNGERTFLSPILRPVEIVIYKIAGVDERHLVGDLLCERHLVGDDDHRHSLPGELRDDS